jgi:hypothetical protein
MGAYFASQLSLPTPYEPGLGQGQSQKRHLHAQQSVSFMYNPEAPFGLELGAERLMAERKHRGRLPE